ncbi:MAG TPA: SLC13 family permease [Woeseiaceae bacterium]|nr:SLC13 family permease [Woeseiaceae bacterium]
MIAFPDAPDAHAIAVMLLALVAVALFSRQRISLESSGLAVLTALVVGFELFPDPPSYGQVGPVDFLGGFGNPALITIVALLICTKALDVTGALHTVTRLLGNLWLRNARGGLMVTMVGAAVASMFVNNTPLVAMILPVLVAVCIRTQTPVNGVLMPVGFATIIGGMGTTIGTSTNLLVVDLSARLGLPRFEMFDFTLPVVLAGSAGIVLLWLIGPRVLPDRSAPMSDAAPRVFRGVLHVTDASTAAGRTLAEVRAMTNGRIQLDRIERGEDLFIARLPTTTLRSGDRLYVRGDSRQLKEYEQLLGTPLWRSEASTSESARRWVEEKTQQRLAEIVVTSASSLYGQTLGQSRFLEQYNLSPIAVHAPKGRIGEIADEPRHLHDLRLRVGDVVLVQGDSASMNDLKQSGQVLVLDSALDLPHTSKAGIATVIVGGVVLAASIGFLPILVSALAGVVLCIATRCIEWRQVRAAIDTNLVVMIVTALALGEALMATGATAWIAGLFVSAAGNLSPGAVIALLMLTAALLTEIVTNNAVAILMTPMAFSIAAGLGMPAESLVLAVMFGANMSYLTPVGYQTNLMVMNAGGYRFTDFWRLGLPLQLFLWGLLSWLLASGVGIR